MMRPPVQDGLRERAVTQAPYENINDEPVRRREGRAFGKLTSTVDIPISFAKNGHLEIIAGRTRGARAAPGTVLFGGFLYRRGFAGEEAQLKIVPVYAATQFYNWKD